MQSRWDINFFNMTRKEKILLILYEHSSGIDGNSDEVTSKGGCHTYRTDFNSK